VVAQPNLPKAAQIQLKVKAFSLAVTLGTEEAPGRFTAYLQNNYEAVKLVPAIALKAVRSKRVVPVTGTETTLALPVSADDRKTFSQIALGFSTARSTYDLMTDYPYRIFDSQKSVVTSGGLEIETTVLVGNLKELPEGDLSVNVAGSFATSAPAAWSFTLTESRVLANTVSVASLARMLVETAQQKTIAVDLTSIQAPVSKGFDNCATLSLADATGRLIQDVPLCR